MSDEQEPTHIIDEAGQRTRCGLKHRRGQAAGYPVVLARHVQAHVAGHTIVLCPRCAEGGWPT